MRETGYVTHVTTEPDGDELAADVSAGATQITLKDAADFFLPEAETRLYIGSEAIIYTDVDEDTDVVTLAAPLANAYSADEKVTLGGHEVKAGVRVGEDPVQQYTATVPSAMIDRLGENIYDLVRKVVTLYEEDDDLYVGTIIGELPVVDGSYIDPDTLPEPPPTDSVPPASSPAAIVTPGIMTLIVTWLAVPNNDPVTYEVHLSTSSGFTPDSSTLARDDVAGTLAVLRFDAADDQLDPTTLYYVRIVAKDDDGAAAPGAEASGSPLQVIGQTDIQHDSISTPQLQANSVTADKAAFNDIVAAALESEHVVTGRLSAPTDGAGAWRVEIGDLDVPLRWWNETETGFQLSHDAATNRSNVYLSGRMDFGTGSKAENDYVDLQEQPDGFLDPIQRQQKLQTQTVNPALNVSTVWPAATAKGNLLLALVAVKAASGSTPPTITPDDALWSLVDSRVTGAMRLSLYQIPNAAKRAGAETFFLNLSSHRCMALFEYANMATVTPLDRTTGTTGTSATVSTGTTSTTTQAAELWFAAGARDHAAGPGTDPFGGPTGGFSGLGEIHGLVGAATPQLSATAAARNATATGAASTTWPLDQSEGWCGIIATFKAKNGVGDPEPPETNRVRIYSKDVDGHAALYAMTDTGLTSPVSHPTGAIIMYGGATAPDGWEMCDGSTLDRTVFGDLFDVIGTTFGAGDGSTTFTKPDLRSRFPVGAGTYKALGGTEGVAEASRTTLHSHGVTNHGGHSHGLNTASNATLTGGGVHVTNSTTQVGGDHDHGGNTGNALGGGAMPSLGVNFIIKT